MADTVDTNVIFQGTQRYTVQLISTSDGTGESDVVKVDISTLVGPIPPAAPTKVAIEKVQYAIQGFTSVLIKFDRGTDVVALRLPTGSGLKDFSKEFGIVDDGTGGTGDVLLTTAGAVSGATYDIILWLKLMV